VGLEERTLDRGEHHRPLLPVSGASPAGLRPRQGAASMARCRGA
jgi:hypothetical protein